jgi:tetratricopeptide (TPR) repeat protein
MGLFRAKAAYDRTRILEAAGRARAKKRRAQAIELYRRVLAREPSNGELHARLAPLLAETGQHFDAWWSYKAVARACLRAGQGDRALATYREATLYLPREVEAWHAVARLQHKAGRSREAVETLLEGSRNLRTRWLRPQAIYLLRHARDLDNWNFEVVLELARLLASCEQTHEARLLLAGLALRVGGPQLRRVRAAELRVSPGPRTLWRWLRECLRPAAGAPAEAEEAPRQRSSVVPLHGSRRG